MKIVSQYDDINRNSFHFRLLTPPGTPLFPSLEMESQKSVMSQIGTPKPRPTALKSRVRKISLYYNMDDMYFEKFGYWMIKIHDIVIAGNRKLSHPTFIK